MRMKLKSRVEFLNESVDDLFSSVSQGDYICSRKSLTSLNELNLPYEIQGNFFCEDNILTDLKGCPEEIHGRFKCSQNFIKTLKDGPKYVKFSYSCDRNSLTDLEGSPEKIYRNFNCSDNNLTSLKGHPKFVGGDFHISGNPEITDDMIDELRKNCIIKGKLIKED